MKHTYLGDGVYATYNGYETILRVGSHNNDDGMIVLDSEVMAALQKFIAEIGTEKEGKPSPD